MFEMLVSQTTLFIVILLVIVSIALYKHIINLYIRFKFPQIESEVKYYLDKAYNIVFAEDLSVYLSSGTILTVEDKEYTQLLRKLLNIFKLLVGTKQYNFYVKVFGNEDVFIDYISIYFNERVYEDVIKHVMTKATQKTLSGITENT